MLAKVVRASSPITLPSRVHHSAKSNRVLPIEICSSQIRPFLFPSPYLDVWHSAPIDNELSAAPVKRLALSTSAKARHRRVTTSACMQPMNGSRGHVSKRPGDVALSRTRTATALTMQVHRPMKFEDLKKCAKRRKLMDGIRRQHVQSLGTSLDLTTCYHYHSSRSR